MSVTKLLLALVFILCSAAVKVEEGEFNSLQFLVSLVGEGAEDLSNVFSEEFKGISLPKGKPLAPEQVKEMQIGTSRIQNVLSVFSKGGIIHLTSTIG